MRAYNIDLRKKVIKYIIEGNSQKAVSEIFDLNKVTVNRWWLRYKREGDVSARKNLGSKPKVDVNQLIKYVEGHPDSRLCDIGLKFNVSGISIHRYLKKLGFSYKKKPSPTWKQMKKNAVNILN